MSSRQLRSCSETDSAACDGRLCILGPGDGGVPREQRWSIVYNPGQTPDEYAVQLDALKVELAVVSGPNQLTYVSNFSNATHWPSASGGGA